MPVVCDGVQHVGTITFQSATPSILFAERIFWEKAMAAYAHYK